MTTLPQKLQDKLKNHGYAIVYVMGQHGIVRELTEQVERLQAELRTLKNLTPDEEEDTDGRDGTTETPEG
jgi:hypothetical protein